MSRVHDMTLDDYVNEVDYGDTYKNYIPSQEAIEFVNMVNMIYGTELENETPIMHYQMFDAMHTKKDICIVAHRGSGKALGLDEVVYMADTGEPVKVKDVKLGDKILTPNGKSTTVIWKSKIFYNDTYTLTTDDGRKVLSCKHHFWRVNQVKKTKYDYVLTTEELKERYRIKIKNKVNKKGNWEYTARIPLSEPIEYEDNIIEPVVNATSLAYLIANRVKPEHYQDLFLMDGDITLTTPNNQLFLPKWVFTQSLEYRFKLLDTIISLKSITKQGLLLTKTGNCSIQVSSKRLGDDLAMLGRSLGIYSSVRHSYAYSYLTFDINKQHTTITGIHSKGIKPTQCISVDAPDKMFLTSDLLPTVNSTSMAQNLFFYMCIYGELPQTGKVDFAIYVSDTVDNGCKTMTHNMEYTWENSPFLQELIPQAKFTMGRWTMTNANGHTLVVRTYGALTGIRGGREKNRRPKVAVIDDVLSDSTATSESKLEAIKNTIFKAIEEAMHPTSLQILIGTPFHSKCVVSEAVASANYTNIVFPICEQFPVAEEDFKGSWEDRFPYAVVKRKYDKAKNGKGDLTLQGFYQELMLMPTSKDRRMIDTSMFGISSRKNFIGINLNKYNFYITTDFATSDKESSDFSFILVWAYDDDEKLWLVDGHAGKNLMDVNIDKLFDLAEKWSPNQVGVEINGQQGGFVPWIRREMETRNVWFKFASSDVKDSSTNAISGKDGIRSSGNKMSRLSVLYPDITRGKFGFMKEDADAEWYVELMKEFLSVVPEGITSAHDDGIDCFSQIQYIKLYKPYYSGGMLDGLKHHSNERTIFKKHEEEVRYNSSYIV